MSIGSLGVYVPLLFLVASQYWINRLWNYKNILPTTNIKLYIAYIVVFLLCSAMNGDGNYGLNSLLIGYLLCIFSYCILGQMIKSLKVIKVLVYALIIVLIIDIAITLLQYYNISIGWTIWYIFNNAETVKQSIAIEQLSFGAQELGNDKLFCPGLFPSIVYNGYMVSTLGILILYMISSTHRTFFRVIYYGLLLITIFALLFIQQRAAFFLFIFLIFIVNYSKHKSLTILCTVLLILAYLSFNVGINEDTIGRLADTEDSQRERLYQTGIEYILQNIIWGGRMRYAEINGLSAHNVIINSFLYGGFIGALLILTIFTRMSIKSLKIIKRNFKKKLSLSATLAYSLLIYNLISLTHNNSLLTGDPIIWILYALMLLSYKFENEIPKKSFTLDHRICGPYQSGKHRGNWCTDDVLGQGLQQ